MYIHVGCFFFLMQISFTIIQEFFIIHETFFIVYTYKVELFRWNLFHEASFRSETETEFVRKSVAELFMKI